MISIAQADLRADIVAEFMLMHRLDRGSSAYGHENRCLDRTVVGFDLAGTGTGVGVGVLEFEVQRWREISLMPGMPAAICKEYVNEFAEIGP